MNTPSNEANTNLETIADGLSASLGFTTTLAKAALVQALRNVCQLEQKQRDYGPGNLIEFGEMGVLIRLSDKRSRLVNLLKDQTKPLNESINDSWGDLSNYGLIGQLMSAKKWPEPENQS